MGLTLCLVRFFHWNIHINDFRLIFYNRIELDQADFHGQFPIINFDRKGGFRSNKHHKPYNLLKARTEVTCVTLFVMLQKYLPKGVNMLLGQHVVEATYNSLPFKYLPSPLSFSVWWFMYANYLCIFSWFQTKYEQNYEHEHDDRTILLSS